MNKIEIMIIIIMLFIADVISFQVPNRFVRMDRAVDISALNRNFEEISNQMLDKQIYDTDNDGIVDNAASAANGNPVGTILAYVSVTAPTGYLYCNGSAVSRSTYANLFAVIGESFGQGDNSTTFNLPDLRGYFLRGMADGQTTDPDKTTRTAMATGGNTGDNIGSVQDSTITAHTHLWNDPISVKRADSGTYTDAMYNSLVGATATSNWIGSTGGSETRPKNVNISYIIKY